MFNWINNHNREGLELIKVQHNAKLQGKDTCHQIDVYWEFRYGLSTHKVIIQAKERSSDSVSQGDMATFKYVIDDLGDVDSYFVTTIGYQSGALKIAKANKIKTFILRKPEDIDWEGVSKEITLTDKFIVPISGGDDFTLEVGEIDITRSDVINEKFTIWDGIYPVVYQNGAEQRLPDLFERICNKIGVGERRVKCSFEYETYIKLINGDIYSLIGFDGHFGLREHTYEYNVDYKLFVDYILKDYDSGEIKGVFNEKQIQYALDMSNNAI